MMLMDEPFSALDALTRGTLQDEVRRICQETGQTAFMITHDVDEAIYLADRIVLMTNGPGAVLAEIVENPLPQGPRARRDPQAPALLRGAQPHHRFPGQPRRSFVEADAGASIRAACRWCGRACLRRLASTGRRRSRIPPSCGWRAAGTRAFRHASTSTRAPRGPLPLPLSGGEVGGGGRG